MRCNQPLDGRAKPIRAPLPDRHHRPATAPRTRPPARRFDDKRLWLFGRFDPHKLPATKAIIALTLLIFGAQVMSAIAREQFQSLLLGANPVDDLRFGTLYLVPGDPVVDPMVVLSTEPWRLLTACFVHFGIIHFGLNMAALVQLARLAEPAIGSARFIIAYVVTGILGFACTVAHVVLFPHATFTAGASGAVFGVMGVILGFLVRRRDPRWKTWAMQAVFYSLLFGFIIRANNSAHIGGLLVGAAFGALFAPGAPKPAASWQTWLAGASLLACVVSLGLAQLSPLPELLERAEQRRGAQTERGPSAPKQRHRGVTPHGHIHQQRHRQQHRHHAGPAIREQR